MRADRGERVKEELLAEIVRNAEDVRSQVISTVGTLVTSQIEAMEFVGLYVTAKDYKEDTGNYPYVLQGDVFDALLAIEALEQRCVDNMAQIGMIRVMYEDNRDAMARSPHALAACVRVVQSAFESSQLTLA